MDVESRETIDEAIDRAKKALTDVGETLIAQLEARIDNLDGWTLTISPITIRLSKPQEQQ